MKISIITTTFNSAETINNRLLSVNARTYPSIEHVIVDGNSSDNILEIVRQYGEKDSKIISEPNGGMYPLARMQSVPFNYLL